MNTAVPEGEVPGGGAAGFGGTGFSGGEDGGGGAEGLATCGTGPGGTGFGGVGGATAGGGGVAGLGTTGATLGGLSGTATWAGATGCSAGAWGAAAGCPAGKGVPQKPQNLLPAGKGFRHLGHMTCCTACGGFGGVYGVPSGACNAFPHREHAGAVAGLGVPQDAHRIYRIVPCSSDSEGIGSTHRRVGPAASQQ